MKYIAPCLAVVLATNCTPIDSPAGPPNDLTVSAGDFVTDDMGRCFTRQAGRTQTEIVNQLVEVVPAQKDQNGVVINPAVFRNVTRPRAVQVAEGAQFEAVCPQRYTADFVATLQRALIVRRAYDGSVTGVYDAATIAAVTQFQRKMGIDSPMLAVIVAQDLGIIAVAQ